MGSEMCIRDRAYSDKKVPSRFYLGDLVTHMGDREIRSVSRRLPDYPGELACMWLALTSVKYHGNL